MVMMMMMVMVIVIIYEWWWWWNLFDDEQIISLLMPFLRSESPWRRWRQRLLCLYASGRRCKPLSLLIKTDQAKTTNNQDIGTKFVICQIGFWRVVRCSYEIAYICEVRPFYLFMPFETEKFVNLTRLLKCEIADTKKWVHGAPTHWRAHARIRRPVSLYVNTYLGENARFGVLAEKNAFYRFQPFSSRCQDYTWSLNPQNRHCYKVCRLENFWSTQQITHLVGRATTHTATRQTTTGFLLRWHESFARFRYFLVYHSLARPNPSHPWHWDCLPIVRMFSPEINWRGPGQPGWQWGGWFCKISIWCLANFRFLFDVWQTWVHSVKHIWRLLRLFVTWVPCKLPWDA